MYKGRICEPGSRLWACRICDRSPDDLSLIGDGARVAWLNRMPVVLLLRKRALVSK